MSKKSKSELITVYGSYYISILNGEYKFCENLTNPSKYVEKNTLFLQKPTMSTVFPVKSQFVWDKFGFFQDEDKLILTAKQKPPLFHLEKIKTEDMKDIKNSTDKYLLRTPKPLL